MPPAILLMGPTASGKTDLAMALHKRLPVELISVDSALVYRGMDIGTAKPTRAELAETPHQLIDIRGPNEAYSAEHFCRDALDAMAQITAKGKIPLLAGGTMLYFRALQYGLSRLPPSYPEIRSALEQRMQISGLADLHAELSRVDPLAAQRIHTNDSQRIMRALEVWQITGQPISQLQQAQKGHAMPYQPIKLALAPQQRDTLRERINQRFLAMLDAGLVDEVKQLMARGDLNADMPSMRSVGYRQVWSYLHGEYDYASMIQKAQAATRQLAKRQLTWMRKEQAVHWLDSEQSKTGIEQIELWLKHKLNAIHPSYLQ